MTDTTRREQPTVITLEPLSASEADNVGAIDCLTEAISDLARSTAEQDADNKASLNALAFQRIMDALAALTDARPDAATGQKG